MSIEMVPEWSTVCPDPLRPLIRGIHFRELFSFAAVIQMRRAVRDLQRRDQIACMSVFLPFRDPDKKFRDVYIGMVFIRKGFIFCGCFISGFVCPRLTFFSFAVIQMRRVVRDLQRRDQIADMAVFDQLPFPDPDKKFCDLYIGMDFIRGKALFLRMS
ncbi:hypothetical protein CEXT_85931 [Caerostris extrusa]|uniref:Uncharacterized protein n=1 Tax=Caerostris extrusa TaxID=172846 RepID=A0AAV4Y5Q4_CAEEX|nr:hypothetical protein CEXT_85931 [Caerostris extrusa]